jgi:hypothetical protein
MYSEACWSRISDTPVFLYDEWYDARLCFWSGVSMTRTIAQMIIAINWYNIFPGKKAIELAYDEYRKFQELEIISKNIKSMTFDKTNIIYFLIGEITGKASIFDDHLYVKYSPQEAFSWLLKENEIVVKRNKDETIG